MKEGEEEVSINTDDEECTNEMLMPPLVHVEGPFANGQGHSRRRKTWW